MHRNYKLNTAIWYEDKNVTNKVQVEKNENSHQKFVNLWMDSNDTENFLRSTYA